MQLRGKPAASIVYFSNLCTNNLFKCAYNVLSPRTATVWVKKRNERGGRSHSSVTLRRREEEEPTERRKRRQQEQMQRGSQAVHFLYSKKASSAHRGLCAPFRLFFFFLLFHPLSFSFSYKILQSGMRETTTLCPLQQAMSTPSKTSFCSSQATNTKGRKRLFFPSLKVREQVNAFHSTNMRNVSARP